MTDLPAEIANPLREHFTDQFKRWLVGRSITCPLSGKVLDYRTAVFLNDSEGTPAVAIDPDAALVVASSEAPLLHGYAIADGSFAEPKLDGSVTVNVYESTGYGIRGKGLVAWLAEVRESATYEVKRNGKECFVVLSASEGDALDSPEDEWFDWGQIPQSLQAKLILRLRELSEED